MSDVTAPQRYQKPVSASRLLSVSFVGQLEGSEILSSGLAVIEIGNGSPGDLTITSKSISIAALEINGKTVPIGQAVQFLVAGGIANTEYTIRVTATSDSTPAQILVGGVILDVAADPA